MNARAELIGEANAELKELEAKDDLTAEEVQRAEFLRNAVKQQNVEMLQLDRMKKWEEELQKYEEEHSELTESEWAQQQQRQGIQEAKTLQKERMPVRETVPQAPVREQTGDQTVVEPAEQTPATENAGSSPEHIRRIMYQRFVHSVDEAVRELNLEGMSIELIETAADLPEHIRSKPGALRAEGAFDQQTGTVYLVAENLAPSRVRKVLLHEVVGHKGLHQLFGKRYGSFLEQIANDYADGVAAVASRRGLDLMDPAQRIEAADEFLAEMAETRGGEDVSVWKRIVAAVRGFFRRMGFHATWTDDEIADLFRQSRKTLKRNRAAKGESTRLALPDDKANFKSALKDFAAGILNRRLPITVTSETPPVLRNLKLKNGTRIGNRRITIPYSVIEKAIGDRASTTTGEGHALSLEDLEKLPDSLYKPVMVLESDKEDCVEIYTEIFDTNNDPVLVALALDYGEVSQSKNKEYEIRVNSIRSIYGKEHHNTPVNRLKDGKGLYVDMEKAESWKLAAGVQFPGASILRSSNPNITLVNENFKPQNEKSSRFSIFGEEGVRRMENAVQLLENLSTAKQMTADGKDAKAIKLATGWELGGDGKWRMEMPDAVFTTRAKLPDGAEYDRTLWDVVNTTNGKLSEYVVADEIFEAYPELKDYHFQIVQMPPEVGGSFKSDTKTIYINQLGLTAALKMVDDAQARLSDETLTAAERKSAQHSVDLWTEQIFSQIDETLVHEVQHAIQHIEGFATGSNVRHFIDHPEYDPKRLEKVTYYREKLEKAQKNLEKYPELKKMVDRYVELEDVLFSDDNVQVDEAAIDAEMDQIKAHFESLGKRELLMDYISGRDNYKMAKDAAEKHKLDPVESYRRTAGEVEARNVQERMDMTMEERLNSLLSETEDVAEKDKIYLNGLVRGGSEMAADRPYYKIPFSEGLRDAVDPAKKNERSPVFITTTGSILQKLGFTALPMMMNRRHLRLNYYSKAEFERIYGRMRDEEHAHNLRLNLKEIVSDLEHPLAVVVNTRPTAKPGSVAVITDINVNGKKVVIPVLVSVESRADNNRIDAHLVLTVYDSKDWIGDFLKPAVEIEKSGKPGVFYTDPEKAGKYRVLRINKEQVPFGFTGHTIQDIGINVKSQSETLQFKSWFGDSKVVDENGKPLVVYHGTNWDGWEFDTENGAFFSEKEDYAEEMAAQRGGSRIVKAYLSIRNPLVVKVPGNKMADPEFEARIIAEAKSKGHDGVKLETDTNNEIEKDVFWVAFEPNQIKSATDNVGTFDPGNPDVRFSVAPDDAFVQAWAKVLLPVVSTQYINVDGAAAYLMDHGIEVYAGRDDDTLRKACVLFQIFVLYRIDC